MSPYRMSGFIVGILWLVFGWIVPATAFEHGQWNELLRSHVQSLEGGRETKVDYVGMQRDRPRLLMYLQSLSGVTQTDFSQWSKHEQLAFLINAYNAWTVELILTKYPDLDSIKDLGSLFSSPWKKKFIPLFGETISLDGIEHDYIRGSGLYNEPRIHFAVNCASVGCPALRTEAYRGELLDTQLEDATRKFLADRSRNRLAGKSLEISSIFKWYREDFQKGWRGAGTLPEFLVLYRQSLGLSDLNTQKLLDGTLQISFLSYDWSLNSLQ